MKIKKKELESVLSTLYVVNAKENKEFGLLTEEIPMSLRRFLQKIRKELITAYDEFRQDIIDIHKEYNKKTIALLPSEVSEKEYLDPKNENHQKFLDKKKEFEADVLKELTALFEEDYEIKSPLASLDMILAINTKVNYDFDLIEKIAQ